MSATTAPGPRVRERRPPVSVRPAVQTVVIVTIALDVAVLVAGIVAGRGDFVTAGWDVLAWMAAVAIVGAASLSFESGSQLGLDMPLLLAAGFLFGPIVAGVVAVLAYVDPRELRGSVPILRALFNRAQTSLSVMAATVVYMGVVDGNERWPSVLLGAILAVGVDSLLNYGIVAGVLSLHERIRYTEGLSRLHFGMPSEFAVTWAGFGLLSLTLAATYRSSGVWALVIFAVPLLLARQSLSRSERLDGAARRLDTQSDALRDVAATIVDERRDERLTLAAGLHDEVLPPLYQVHLLGQVLRQDLATGQLFALEDDLPGLLKAADSASESMRNLIRGLRTSALGRAGLCETLRVLVEYLRQESKIDIQLSATSTDVDGAPITQLLVYQVAREAIRNAIRHSQAEAISVLLSGGRDEICIVVEDDGIGFVPGVVDRGRHFGLELMRERVELAGGVLRVDSTRGAGTRVVARVPSGSLLEPQDE